ncbi:MAG TPA: hypothetical protein VK814_12470 [Acidobacteriaceae bacterium]|jgi:hypothetical protein|nr:hypothetical protein [Acidobacteriaceae bacterium]
MFQRQDPFSSSAPASNARLRRNRAAANVSLRKVFRLAIVLAMSFLCWLGLGCFAFQMLQLAGR